MGYVEKGKRKKEGILIKDDEVLVTDPEVDELKKLPITIEFPRTIRLGILLTDYAYKEGLIYFIVRDSLGKNHYLKSSKNWITDEREFWKDLNKNSSK